MRMCNYVQKYQYKQNCETHLGKRLDKGDVSMVNEERLKPMVKMAMFDKNDGAECKPMIEYAREDYVAWQLLGSFVTGTIAFVILFGMEVLMDVEKFLGMLNAKDLMGLLISTGIRYGVFLFIYLLATYIVYQLRYSAGRKKVKKYFASLKCINNFYAREDKLRTPLKDDEE